MTALRDSSAAPRVVARDPVTAFVDWVLTAPAGAALVYHRGFPVAADADLFAAARRASDQGKVVLYSRRPKGGEIEYVAKRRWPMASGEERGVR